MTPQEYDLIRDKILSPITINIVKPIKAHAGYGPYITMSLSIVDFALKTGNK